MSSFLGVTDRPNLTGGDIKAAYEAQPNTNEFSDAEKQKLKRVAVSTVSEMALIDDLADGQICVVLATGEAFKYVAGSVAVADGALVVDAAGMGAGRLVSTRTTYADYAEAVGDARTFTAGTVLTIKGVTGTLTATDAAGNWGVPNAGGQEFIAWSLTGDVRLWGVAEGSDCTAAIQRAINSGESTLSYRDLALQVDGQLELASNQSHIGNSATFFRGVQNNAQRLFSGDALENITFQGLDASGNVDRIGAGYQTSAAAIYLTNSSNITLRNTNLSGFASGIQAFGCTGLELYGGIIKGNILTGISGICDDVIIDGAAIVNNGYASAGQTHDVYFINSSNGCVRDAVIGPNVDSTADSLVIRYDQSEAATYPAFSSVDGWYIHDNRMRDNGMKFGSDPGVAVAERKPPKNIRVANNDFSGGAGLWFDDPENCKSWGNEGIGALTCRVGSQFAGYEMGYVSKGDECNAVVQSALSAIRHDARDKIIFERTTINNGPDPAFNADPTYGGLTACTIIEPTIKGSGEPFDAAFLSRYETNLEVTVKATGSMRHMARQALPETGIGAGGTYTPDNHTASEQIFLARLNGVTATIAAPTVAATGMVLRLMLRQAYASGSVGITFDAAYKLTADTSAALVTNANGQRMYLEFIYEVGAWRELGSTSWTEA